MRRSLLPPVVIACCALLFVAGCGSSKSSSSGTSGTTSSTTATTSAASGGLKTDSAPKYASPPASAPVQSGLVQVAYTNIAIDPDTVKAKIGSTIKWTNNDPEKCNVTSEGGPYKFASGDFGEGGTFELKLTKAGTIHYECTYYPATMNGTIEVVQ
jgi:plastocyanin